MTSSCCNARSIKSQDDHVCYNCGRICDIVASNNTIQDVINQTAIEVPKPPLHHTAYTKEEVLSLIEKDRHNLVWAMTGKLRNKYTKI